MSKKTSMEEVDANKIEFLIKHESDPEIPKTIDGFSNYFGMGNAIHNAKLRGTLKKPFRLLLENHFDLQEGELVIKEAPEPAPANDCFTPDDRAVLYKQADLLAELVNLIKQEVL